jgi:hypothetical protein
MKIILKILIIGFLLGNSSQEDTHDMTSKLQIMQCDLTIGSKIEWDNFMEARCSTELDFNGHTLEILFGSLDVDLGIYNFGIEVTKEEMIASGNLILKYDDPGNPQSILTHN